MFWISHVVFQYSLVNISLSLLFQKTYRIFFDIIFASRFIAIEESFRKNKNKLWCDYAIFNEQSRDQIERS